MGFSFNLMKILAFMMMKNIKINNSKYTNNKMDNNSKNESSFERLRRNQLFFK